MFRPSYTYYSYENKPDGRGYIGYRKCPKGVMPWEDTKYFGSYTDKSFAPDKKIIIRVFLSQNEAKNFETTLQLKHDVAKNSHFANKSISGDKFLVDEDVAEKMRKPKSASHRKNISLSKSGSKNPRYGKPGINLGKTFSDEWRKNLSDAKSPQKYTWYNSSLNLEEENKSCSEIIEKYRLSKSEVYRLSRKEKSKLKSGWEIIW